MFVYRFVYKFAFILVSPFLGNFSILFLCVRIYKCVFVCVCVSIFIIILNITLYSIIIILNFLFMLSYLCQSALSIPISAISTSSPTPARLIPFFLFLILTLYMDRYSIYVLQKIKQPSFMTSLSSLMLSFFHLMKHVLVPCQMPTMSIRFISYNLSNITPTSIEPTLKRISMHFDTVCLDYRNFLFTGLPVSILRPLQLV